MDSLLDLPDDTLRMVIKHLDLVDRIHVELTCTRLYDLAREACSDVTKFILCVSNEQSCLVRLVVADREEHAEVVQVKRSHVNSFYERLHMCSSIEEFEGDAPSLKCSFADWLTDILKQLRWQPLRLVALNGAAWNTPAVVDCLIDLFTEQQGPKHLYYDAGVQAEASSEYYPLLRKTALEHLLMMGEALNVRQLTLRGWQPADDIYRMPCSVRILDLARARVDYTTLRDLGLHMVFLTQLGLEQCQILVDYPPNMSPHESLKFLHIEFSQLQALTLDYTKIGVVDNVDEYLEAISGLMTNRVPWVKMDALTTLVIHCPFAVNEALGFVSWLYPMLLMSALPNIREFRYRLHEKSDFEMHMFQGFELFGRVSFEQYVIKLLDVVAQLRQLEHLELFIAVEDYEAYVLDWTHIATVLSGCSKLKVLDVNLPGDVNSAWVVGVLASCLRLEKLFVYDLNEDTLDKIVELLANGRLANAGERFMLSIANWQELSGLSWMGCGDRLAWLQRYPNLKLARLRANDFVLWHSGSDECGANLFNSGENLITERSTT